MTEPISDAEKIAQLQQQVQELVERNRQAEVDSAYWRGRCESLEQNLHVTPAVTVAKPEPAAVTPAPAASFSPDKLLPLLDKLLPAVLPLLSNPEVLKLLLPLFKPANAPRPADG